MKSLCRDELIAARLRLSGLQIVLTHEVEIKFVFQGTRSIPEERPFHVEDPAHHGRGQTAIRRSLLKTHIASYGCAKSNPKFLWRT